MILPEIGLLAFLKVSMHCVTMTTQYTKYSKRQNQIKIMVEIQKVCVNFLMRQIIHLCSVLLISDLKLFSLLER